MSTADEKTLVGYYLTAAILKPSPETIGEAVGALSGATDETYHEAMKALRKTYPAKWAQMDEFEAMLDGLRAQLRAPGPPEARA